MSGPVCAACPDRDSRVMSIFSKSPPSGRFHTHSPDPLSSTLKAVPAPRKGKRDGNDIAIVPASKGGGHEEHEVEEPEDE